MKSIDPAYIATILEDAPAWAKLGLMDRDLRVREVATETLAAILAARLGREDQVKDPRQMLLPIPC